MKAPGKFLHKEYSRETTENVVQKYDKEIKEINEIMGIELHPEQFIIQEQLSTELSDKERQFIKPDMMGLFNYTEKKIIILQDRIGKKSNEVEGIFKAARFPIKDIEEIREFLKKSAVIHELAHAAHFTIDPTIFEKQNEILQQIAQLSQEVIQDQQELQSSVLELEKLLKEKGIDLDSEVSKAPEDVKEKTEKVKNLSTTIEEKRSKLQSLDDKFSTVVIFSDAIADVITSRVMGNMKDAYYLLVGKSPEFKNLGPLGKLSKKLIESSIRLSAMKRGVNPELLKLRVQGIEFIENIVQKFGGDIKAALKFVIENPPLSLDEIKNPENYLKRVKLANFE